MRSIFPNEEIKILSELRPEDIMLKLHEKVLINSETDSVGKFLKSGKEFFGKIEHNSFEVRRIRNHKNSISPLAKGVVKSKENGSLITVKLQLESTVKLFIIVWAIMFSMFTILFFTMDGVYDFGIFKYLAPLGIVIPYIGVMYGYNTDARKMKAILNLMFQS
jgi:hypothetical protein